MTSISENVATGTDKAKHDDLFFQTTVDHYVQTPRFLRRDWLAAEVDKRLDDPECRFVLLTAEPGAGKSTFMAQLAHDHLRWPRYFIRRDQRSPLAGAGARSFLMRIGFQLAESYPGLFTRDDLVLDVEQEIGTLHEEGAVLGIDIKKLIVSPFYRRVMVRVRQNVQQVGGSLWGMRINTVIAEPRLLPLDDLHHLALFDPARQLGQSVVILLDALDELRYHDRQDNILGWLTNCPSGDLPANVRFVLSSRPPDEALELFCTAQTLQVRTITLKVDDRESEPGRPSAKAEGQEGEPGRSSEIGRRLRADARTYADQVVDSESLGRYWASAGKTPAAFAAEAAAKAAGNLGYLDAIARALDQAIEHKDADTIQALLSLRELPGDLKELYIFFLRRVKDQVKDLGVKVTDSATGPAVYGYIWDEIYLPALGAMSIAREPLTLAQIQAFGNIRVEWSYFAGAMERLGQFLDRLGDRYRLYHATLPEFLTASETKQAPATADLYLEPAICHGRVVQFYRQLVGGWAQANWQAVDEYGWRHLTAHAEQARRDGNDRLLFDLCDGGFLTAKRRAVASPAALEDDWERAFRICRAVGDWGRFVQYGVQRAYQFTEVAYLQNAYAADTAAHLAVRRQDGVSVERLAEEIEMIASPSARLNARLALFRRLVEAGSDHPVVEMLARRLNAFLETLSPGREREYFLSQYVPVLALGKQPGWQAMGVDHLGEVEGLVPRITLLATLARDSAIEGKPAKAAMLLRQALSACRRFDLRGEDVVPDLLEMVGAGERVDDPAGLLAEALAAILQAVPVLRQQDAVRIVQAARRQIARLEDRARQLNLEAFAASALDGAGLHAAAREMVRDLVAANLMADPSQAQTDEEPPPAWAAGAVAEFESAEYAGYIVELFALLPAIVLFGETTAWDTWLQNLVFSLQKVSSAPDLRWITCVAAEKTSVETLRPALQEALHQIGMRAESVAGVRTGEIGFPITAALAGGYARLGDHAAARARLEQILDLISITSLGPCRFPEQAEDRVVGANWAWLTACWIGERELVLRTLDWLLATVPFVMPREDRGKVWSAAVAAAGDLPDAELAAQLFDRLKLVLVKTMDAGGYVATAWLQLAEAYVGLGLPEDGRRLVGESMRIARASAPAEVWSPASMVDVWTRAARLYAALGNVQASAGLLVEALQSVADLEGDNTKAGCLRVVLGALGELSACQSPGKEAAGRLLVQAAQLAEGIGLKEYAVMALAAAVYTGHERDLPVPTVPLERLAWQYLEAEDKSDVGSLRTVMEAIHALSRAQPDAARPLLEQVERAVEDLPHAGDYERARACQAQADLSGLYAALGESRLPAGWHERAAEMAQQTQDPTWRTDACIALAHVEAWLGNPRSAGDWLTEAVAAWRRIDEWMYASRHVGSIVGAWLAIPDRAERRARLDEMNAILRRIPDPNWRDALRAQLALSFWDDPAQFAGLSAHVTGQNGIESLLTALHEADTIPEGLLPGTLYDILEKASRLPHGFFVGDALLATQVRVRRGIADRDVDIPALAAIEAAIRQIVPWPIEAA